MSKQYISPGPAREEIDSLTGKAVLQFGTDWCGVCQGAEPIIDDALRLFENVNHIRVEDGPGRRLGRSFKVKLWPTLIFLKDGVEVGRLVRPNSKDEIKNELSKLI